MPFDPDAFLGKAPSPSFDPDAFLGKEPTKVPSSPTTTLGAFGASAAEGLGVGQAAYRTGLAAAAMAPPVAPIVGPLSKPVAGIVGGIAGGILASIGVGSIEEAVDKTFGTNIKATREKQQQEHQIASTIGSITGSVLGGGMRPGMPTSVRAGAAQAGLMGGIGAAQRAVEGGDILDPKAIALDLATGAFTTPTKATQRAFDKVMPPREPQAKPPQQPPVYATPEEREAFIKAVAEQSPLTQTAIRNKETGQIEPMGPKHDEARKAETVDTHDQGFLTKDGQFLDRKQALEQAKRTGQVPEDVSLEFPKEGLHSGDMRTAGDERFKLDTIKKDVGEPKKLSSLEIDKLISELPPVKEGNTRVFRGQYTGPKGDIAEWIKEAQARSGHTAAEGRWWTTDPEIAKWYMEEAGEHGGIVHQEVPTKIVEESQVTKADPSVKRFSRDPEKELFLPKEFVGKGILLEEGKKPSASPAPKEPPVTSADNKKPFFLTEEEALKDITNSFESALDASNLNKTIDERTRHLMTEKDKLLAEWKDKDKTAEYYHKLAEINDEFSRIELGVDPRRGLDSWRTDLKAELKDITDEANALKDFNTPDPEYQRFVEERIPKIQKLLEKLELYKQKVEERLSGKAPTKTEEPKKLPAPTKTEEQLRKEAWDRAIKTGQLPKDAKPEFIKEGLHSGDFRKYGVKGWEVTPEQPAGVPKPPVEEAPALKQMYEEGKTHDEGIVAAKTTKGLIGYLTDKYGPDHYLSQVLSALSPHLPEDLPVTIVKSREEMAALNKEQNLPENTPAHFVPGKGLFLEHGKGTNSIIAGHEIGHAILADKIRSIEAMSKDHPDYAKGQELLATVKGIMEDVNSKVDRSTLSPEQNKALNYALKDIHEFLSDGLFNPGIMKHLLAIDAKRPSGFLSKVVNAIGKFFGMDSKQYTALHKLLGTAEKIAKFDHKTIKNMPNSALASRLSQEIHDQLGQEGIAVAHSSPHRFGRFNWIKHALTGEGAMSKGHGSYFSTKDSTDRGYAEMAKERAVAEYLKDPKNIQDKQVADSIISREHRLDLELSDLEDQIRKLSMEIGGLEDTIRYAPPDDPYTQFVEGQIERQRENKDLLIHDFQKINDALEDTRLEFEVFYNSLKPKVKVPTYHATLDVKPHELLDWDSRIQSDLVNEAFRKLGIDPGVGSNDSTLDRLLQNDRWHGNLEEDGFIGISIFGSDYTVGINEATFSPEGKMLVEEYVIKETGEVVSSFEEAKKSIKEDIYLKHGINTGETLYEKLAEKLEPQDKTTRDNITDLEARYIGRTKASIALAEQRVVGNVHDAQFGTEKKYRNYVMFDDNRIKINFTSLASEGVAPLDKAALGSLEKETTPEVAKAAEKVDVRSIPNEEEFYKHATDVYERYGEAEALKFFEDYKKNQAERTIPVPKNNQELDDAFHKVNTFTTKDVSEHTTAYKNNTDAGVDTFMRQKWFDSREGYGVTLTPEEQARMQEVLGPLDAENKALIAKAKNLDLPVGREWSESQSRQRVFAPVDQQSRWASMLKEFFENKMPLGEHMAEEAQAAMERKVFQLDDGRVIELHRQPKDTTVPIKDAAGNTVWKNVRQGTEIWEWKDGRRTQIGHSDKMDFGLGDTWKQAGRDVKVVDGRVADIEKNSPYRYLHDAEASARLANMGLRKMVRDAELLQNLTKSELFKQVGRSPDTPIKDIPKGWKTPNSIDKIPQLRGWYFDPKTAAIIEDFAKVWDNTMWMKLTNQIVKNLMLNPLPHMFNEVMHLYNARGFTGWVNPRRMGQFVVTGRQALNDVGNQTQFYRDIMREGGSILGADPRNKIFDTMLKDAGKTMLEDPATKGALEKLAKKFGTPIGELYNSISSKSQQAMWFTRDVMYVQLIRETMNEASRKGTQMSLKQAIQQVERHMPNYRMPSEVLGSRGLAQVLKNPNVSMFSRYHYGMVRSLAETLADLNPKNLTSVEGRAHFREGADTAMAIAFGFAMLYPIMDAIASGVFGEGSTMRRAGPYHLMSAAGEVASGHKDAYSMLQPVFTFNPMLLTLGQLAINKNIFTGKPVYHPEDTAGQKLGDIATYGARQIPQASALMQSGGEGWLARQFDVKYQSPTQQLAAKKAQEFRERNRLIRERKRAAGTYKP